MLPVVCRRRFSDFPFQICDVSKAPLFAGGAFHAASRQRNLQGEMTQATEGRRGIPAARKAIIIGLTFHIGSTARYRSHRERVRERESDPEVGQWEGTGSRLHHYHQYGDEVDAAQLWGSEQNWL